jgi:asparagine synthase (glutamine-hydrolysing)
MCGILGAINTNVTDAQFAAALKTMRHRGPDGWDMDADALEPNLRFGHHRLAIIDLDERSKQPMRSRDGRHSLTFNGEIFNYRELRRELEGLGEVFRTSSDTEVLLYALIRWGEAALARLDGQFALAFSDHASRTVLLARDQLGIKPLYHARLGGGWVFASEVKAILALGVPPRLRRERIGEYLANLWVMEPDTLFDGVYKLPAASWLRVLPDGSNQTGVYWQAPKVMHPYRSEDEALEALKPLLERAVQSQLVADVPVGAYVSGGVDSSIVATLAARHTSGKLFTVGARFERADKGYEAIPDDGEFIDLIVEKSPHFDHSDLRLSPSLFDEYVRQLRFLDEPIADPAIVPAFLLARAARERGAIVMLSGMGGDELFGGYGRYTALPLLERLGRLPDVANRGLLGLALLGQGVPNGVLRKRARDGERVLRASRDPWPLAYANIAGHFALPEIDALVGASWREAYLGKLRDVLRGWEHQSYLRQAQVIDLKGFLASHNTIYSDKASMAASVEVRVPLMNVELTEFAFGLPDEYKLKSGSTKPLLKRACAEIAGPEFAYRPKAGFAMPIRSWLRGSLLETVRKHVLSEPLCAIFPPVALERLVNEHTSGTREHTWKLWSLLTLALWLETFNVEIPGVNRPLEVV